MKTDVRSLIIDYGSPIVLIGMMGTGKTHFGRMLSQALKLDYHDTDSLVETKAGCSIAEIFERWGEESFRSVEAKTIQDLVHQGPSVISTGGGAIMNTDTAEAIFNGSLSIWVDAPINIILERVGKNRNRPLLACENPQDVLQELMKLREPVYRRALFKISSGDMPAEEALNTVINDMKHFLIRAGSGTEHE